MSESREGPGRGLRVLIVRTGAMGDVLHALPAVAALRAADPAVEIDWVVDPRWAPLLTEDAGAAPVVSRVHLAETKLWSRAPFSRETARSVLSLRSALRARRYDLAVDMQGTLRSAVIAKMAGARRTWGYRDPREAAARWLYSEAYVRRGEHVVTQGAALLGAACGMLLAPAPVALPIESRAESWAAELAGEDRIVVLAASAGWGAKQWPAEHYGRLAAALNARGLRVLVNAPQQDDALAARVVALSGGAAEVVVCNVAGLIALLRRAVLVVGGDSGPAHLAAALGVTLVALYGPTDPARNGPWGAGPMRVLRHPASITSYKRVAVVDPGLAQISVEEVLKAIESVWRPG